MIVDAERLRAELERACDDAGLAAGSFVCWIVDGSCPDGATPVAYLQPAGRIREDTVRVFRAVGAARAAEWEGRAHRLAMWRDLPGLPPVALGPMLRHELEHARRWQRSGKAFYEADEGLRRLVGAAGYAEVPTEREANAAAAAYARRVLSPAELDELARVPELAALLAAEAPDDVVESTFELLGRRVPVAPEPAPAAARAPLVELVLLAVLALAALLAAGCGGGSSRALVPPASWRLGPSPAAPAGTARFSAVSCVSASYCIAVGNSLRHLVSHSLAERWNGKGWTLLATDARDDDGSVLTGVSCVATDFCAAVGTHFEADGSHALTELWDGHAWRVTASSAPRVTSVLAGVSCVSRTFCVAVGNTRGLTPKTFVEIWRGTTWRVVRSPSDRGFTSLASVSCLGASFCAAAGQHSTGPVVSTLAEVWDGSRWRLERTPNVGDFSALDAVSCVAEDWCLAVGSHLHGEGSETLVERREDAWTLRPSPSRSLISGFAALVCASRTACVTVGSQREGPNRTLIAGWDGSQWSIASSPDPSGSNVLNGVSCVPAGGATLSCLAVGSAGPAVGIRTRPLVVVSRAPP